VSSTPSATVTVIRPLIVIPSSNIVEIGRDNLWPDCDTIPIGRINDGSRMAVAAKIQFRQLAASRRVGTTYRDSTTAPQTSRQERARRPLVTE
jgi:hypothetical protein